MVVNTSKIVGFVVLPNDTVREKSSIIFQMIGFDTDADDSATVVPFPIEASIAVDGSIDVDLWPNPEGVRNTLYGVTASLYNGIRPVLVYLGKISVPVSGGPFDLNDLLPVAPPSGSSVDDYIAYLQAAVAQSEAAAQDAEEARDKSRDWAESPAPPDGPDTKSSKTWAGEAEAAADRAEGAEAANAVSYLPQATFDDSDKAQARENIGITNASDTRRKVSWFVTGDHQARINDESANPGLEHIQWGVLRKMLRETKRSFKGSLRGMLHVGDVTWVGAMSVTTLSSVRDAADTMNPTEDGYDLLADADNMTVGDEYPWGHGAALNVYENDGGFSRDRVLAAKGNHDDSGSGSGTNPITNTGASFEKYFGKTSYAFIEGNMGVYVLGADSSTTGGQITRRTFDQARRTIAEHGYVKHWAFLIHQPPAGRNPSEAASPTERWSDEVVLTSGNVTEWDDGNDSTLVTMGPYAGQRTNRTNVYLISPYLGRVMLKHGVDYEFSSDVDAGEDADPYNRIEILPTWQHGPLTTSTTLRMNEMMRLGGCQDGPTTYHMEKLFAEAQPFAVFHGHTGELWNDDYDNIRQVPEWGGAWLVNMNMGIPTRARLGIDPIDTPLISGILDIDADAGTAHFRYWNHTASIDEGTGEYAGDWLSNTHPGVPNEFLVDLSVRGNVDLGTEDTGFDGRKEAGRNPAFNFLAMKRDIREAPSRSEPLRNPDGSLITTTDLEGNDIPTYSIDAPGRVPFGNFAVTDTAKKDINPGDGGYFSFEVPRAVDSDVGGDSNWRDDEASKEMLRLYWETTSPSDNVPVPAIGFEGMDADGNWINLLHLTPENGPVVESDTNVNGTYTKYSDGTLVCTGEVDITNLPTGTGAETTTVTLPYDRVSFGYSPTAQITINASVTKWSESSDRGKYVFSSRSDTTTELTILYYAIAGTSPTGPNGSVGYTLTTRWK